jgi:hypothetical protein
VRLAVAFTRYAFMTRSILMVDSRARESLNCPFNDRDNVINNRAVPCAIKHAADLAVNKNY